MGLLDKAEEEMETEGKWKKQDRHFINKKKDYTY